MGKHDIAIREDIVLEARRLGAVGEVLIAGHGELKFCRYKTPDIRRITVWGSSWQHLLDKLKGSD